MNVLDGKRYKTLNKEFVDLVNGRYGRIPGDICNKLLNLRKKKLIQTKRKVAFLYLIGKKSLKLRMF